MHLSFVRSVQMDSWTEHEIKAMQVGGNKQMNDFLQEHGVPKNSSIKKKYNSRAAALYREVYVFRSNISHQHLRQDRRPRAPDRTPRRCFQLRVSPLPRSHPQRTERRGRGPHQARAASARRGEGASAEEVRRRRPEEPSGRFLSDPSRRLRPAAEQPAAQRRVTPLLWCELAS